MHLPSLSTLPAPRVLVDEHRTGA